MPPNYPALRLARGNMAQATRKGSNSGACGRGARAKTKNDTVAQPQGQGYGRTTPWSCSECDNAIDENDQSIECHMCKLWNHKRCTELSEAEYRVLEREGESLLWQRNACIRDRAAGNAQASRTDVKLDMLVKLFQDIVQRLEKLEGAYTGKYLEEKIEEAVDKKVTEVLEEAK